MSQSTQLVLMVVATDLNAAVGEAGSEKADSDVAAVVEAVKTTHPNLLHLEA